MNEITKIHLGRQAFTIAVDAQRELRAYLDAIAAQVGKGDEVLKEIEIRMAELLGERGIEGDKVVLLEDVRFLKEQLGAPKDFKDEDAETDEDTVPPTSDDTAPKRLYRDTQNGMLAGVSSGLAAYFGIDTVIVRLIFIVLTIAWGWGLLLYLILWLVVPEAKTNSERLQMRGKAVTVDSLKEIVDRADVQGAAQRASRSVGPALERTFKIIAVLIGCALIAIAVSLFLALMGSGSYLVFHHGEPLQGIMPFPVGAHETVFAVATYAMGLLIAVCLLLWGLSLALRRTISGWVVGSLVALILIALTVATIFTPDTIRTVRDRYAAAHHTTSQALAPFNKVELSGDATWYRLERSNTYALDIRYVGNVPPDTIKTSVRDGVLRIDTVGLGQQTACRTACILDHNNVELIVRAPNIEELQTADQTFLPPVPATHNYMVR